MDAAAGVVLGDLDPASAAVPDDPPLADAVGAVASVDDSVLPAPDHTVDADILRFPALLWTEYGFPAAKCPYPATIYPEISSPLHLHSVPLCFHPLYLFHPRQHFLHYCVDFPSISHLPFPAPVLHDQSFLLPFQHASIPHQISAPSVPPASPGSPPAGSAGHPILCQRILHFPGSAPYHSFPQAGSSLARQPSSPFPADSPSFPLPSGSFRSCCRQAVLFSSQTHKHHIPFPQAVPDSADGSPSCTLSPRLLP